MTPELEAPVAGTYWVERDRLLAGAYPGHADPERAAERVAALLGLGIDYFIDLTAPGELPPYVDLLPGPYAADPRGHVVHSRRPIPDHGVPRERAHMSEILDEIADALQGGHRVYVHCRAGIGRTGTVVGCHLARRLGDGADALTHLEALWRESGRVRDWPNVPETDEQTDYVREWREPERTPAGAPPNENSGFWGAVASGAGALGGDPRQNRYRGMLVGLALGDALGQATLDRRPGSFAPLTELPAAAGALPRGAWTDDTAIALLLADSLLDTGRCDARDQVERYHRWHKQGYLSSTGTCVGVSANTARAIAQAQWSGKPNAGSHDPSRADKEPMVRAGVAVAWAQAEPERAIALAAEVARTTHQAPLALDACRYYGALLLGALEGARRETLLEPLYAPVPGLWQQRPLRPEVLAVANGGWRLAGGVRPSGGGNAVDGLAIVLWALANGRDYRETVLAAVNLGRDADVNGALAGQLAGALYGVAAIPAPWRAALARPELLVTTADGLLAAALRPAARRG